MGILFILLFILMLGWCYIVVIIVVGMWTNLWLLVIGFGVIYILLLIYWLVNVRVLGL